MEPTTTLQKASRGFKRKIPLDGSATTAENKVKVTKTDGHATKQMRHKHPSSVKCVEDGESSVQKSQTVMDLIGKKPVKKSKQKTLYVLFVGNLPYSYSEADIAHFFVQAGKLSK